MVAAEATWNPELIDMPSAFKISTAYQALPQVDEFQRVLDTIYFNCCKIKD